MAEATQYMYTHKEVVEALLKKQGIHDGIWSLSIEFNLGAAIGGPSPDNLMPTALVGISRIGLERTDKLNNSMAFDASVLNPASPPAKSSAKTKAKSK